MKAVVLAAGKGNRMGILSKDMPKVMIKLRGKPVLEWVLQSLVGRFSEVIIVVGYKKEVVMDYFKNDFKGLKIHYVVQDEQLGTAHAVGLVEGFISDRFLLVYGDLYYNPVVINELLSNPCAGVMTVKKVSNPEDYGVVELRNSRVLRILEKVSNPPSNLVNAGIYLLPVEVFHAIKLTRLSSRGEYELTDSIQLLINDGWRFGVVGIDDWFDVGTENRFMQASELSF